MEDLFKIVYNDEQTEIRIESHRREFAQPLLDCKAIDDGAMEIINETFAVLENARARLEADKVRNGPAMMLIALRVIGINAQAAHDYLNQLMPCQCDSCKRQRGRMN